MDLVGGKMQHAAPLHNKSRSFIFFKNKLKTTFFPFFVEHWSSFQSYCALEIIHKYKWGHYISIHVLFVQFQQKFCKLTSPVYSESFITSSFQTNWLSMFLLKQKKQQLNVGEANCQTQCFYNYISRGPEEWIYTYYNTDHYFLMGHRWTRFYSYTNSISTHIFCLFCIILMMLKS